MLMFESDYTEGAHEEVLSALVKTNRESLASYGFDRYSEAAKQKIRAACDCEQAQVFLTVGGTQTNQLVIDALLDACEGVVACNTGHIATHEAGAIEYTGHKVLTLPHENGKLTACALEEYLTAFYADENHDHTGVLGMVYISHPTEYGTLYTKDELTALSRVCRAHDLPLYLDGARLIYALASDTDVTLPDIAALCDAFYIGGTKCGTLCGEAIVFPGGNAPKRFFTRIKQHGALLAKGRLTGVQFDALFTNDLYKRIGAHAIRLADTVRAALREKGYHLFIPTTTNQIFVVLENDRLQTLSASASFGFWEPFDDTHTVMRIATSWATTDDAVEALIALL
ncbi:MAG: aminotransferase class I/II-fold pyridoxal phosphate-dependent enzyme [Clostridia bacterium]|nr:aminotransferase class I/II-fold pyridoxal phosphate-dependent enzyme [Clostridia bacterium]